MNTLKIEAALAKKYKYRPLKRDLSEKYRKFYLDNIPTDLNVNGGVDTLFTSNGSQICDGYDRIVIGDYGAFIEFSTSPYSFIVKPGQEYRIDDERYSKNVKYHWLTINDNSDVKIYHQMRTVAYADYLPDKYYVSVHEVLVGGK